MSSHLNFTSLLIHTVSISWSENNSNVICQQQSNHNEKKIENLLPSLEMLSQADCQGALETLHPPRCFNELFCGQLGNLLWLLDSLQVLTCHWNWCQAGRHWTRAHMLGKYSKSKTNLQCWSRTLFNSSCSTCNRKHVASAMLYVTEINKYLINPQKLSQIAKI